MAGGPVYIAGHTHVMCGGEVGSLENEAAKGEGEGGIFDCIGDLERRQRQYALAIAYFEIQAKAD